MGSATVDGATHGSNMIAAPEPLLRVRDVAARLQLSMRTVRRHIARGTLPAQKLACSQWRIPQASLEAFLGRSAPRHATIPSDLDLVALYEDARAQGDGATRQAVLAEFLRRALEPPTVR